jgi:23S rRNA (guanosine2251-2'-O)-methyltransferase
MNLLIGRKPVLEALNSSEEIEQVYILYGQTGNIINSIRIAARKRGVKCNLIPLEKFKAITSNPHAQGVAAVISSQKFYELDEIISICNQKSFPLLLLLDSIQDTHNLGAILRTADCSGVDAVILTKHNSAPVNETVVKTSAGAASIVRICRVNNLASAIDTLKQNRFWVVGTSLASEKKYTDIDYKMPIALILGNEEKGIRKLVEEKCDFLISIPMHGKINSLNVSVAAGVLLFEVIRQRSN